MDAVADGGCESRKHPPGLACAAHFQHTTAQRSVYLFDIIGVPKGIRTPVTAVKGRCPRPLDDGDATACRGRDLEGPLKKSNRRSPQGAPNRASRSRASPPAVMLLPAPREPGRRVSRASASAPRRAATPLRSAAGSAPAALRRRAPPG